MTSEAREIRYEVHSRLNQIMAHLLTHHCKHTAIDLWKERFERKIYELTESSNSTEDPLEEPIKKLERLEISKDVSIQTNGVCLFTIYMKNERDGGEEIIELEEAELKKLIPLMRTYLKDLKAELSEIKKAKSGENIE